MENDSATVSTDCKFEIKKIGHRCYRVNTNLNKKYLKPNNSFLPYEKELLKEFKQKFNDFQNNDDVYSYSGDSDFLKSDDETINNNELTKRVDDNNNDNSEDSS